MSSSVTSKGVRFTTSQRDRLIRKAKAEKRNQTLEDHGYEFCEDCGVNGSNTYIDKSHEISVKWACENGQTELCWDVNNIINRCRECHNKHDSNGFM